MLYRFVGSVVPNQTTIRLRLALDIGLLVTYQSYKASSHKKLKTLRENSELQQIGHEDKLTVSKCIITRLGIKHILIYVQ